MQKFFHMPALYVYLLAAVLLVTSVFHAAGFVRQGLYLLLDLNDSVRPAKFSTDIVTFTPAAEAYLNEMTAEQARRTTTTLFEDGRGARSSLRVLSGLPNSRFDWRHESFADVLAQMTRPLP